MVCEARQARRGVGLQKLGWLDAGEEAQSCPHFGGMWSGDWGAMGAESAGGDGLMSRLPLPSERTLVASGFAGGLQGASLCARASALEHAAPAAAMRSLFYVLLSLATVSTTLAADTPGTPGTQASATAADELDDAVPDTVFNGQTVPPMKELGVQDLTENISKGNWLVDFFSPYCPHCIAFKPTWQTLYEFYYTSKPVAATPESEGDSLNSFTRFYNFKFAKVDCVAFKDVCEAQNITNYPTIIQFKDGNQVKMEKGARDLSHLSTWVEEILETVRPGSRREGGPKLPKIGAHSVETGPETEAEIKEKKPAASASLAATPVAAATQAVLVEPTQPKETPNPEGISVPLTPESFQKLITNTLDPWFIKFYAPWCHHCQAMQPNWQQMAREMGGKLNVGEVNCDEQKRLCKDAHVKGYPTLLFFRGGERVEYNGLRGLGDLLDFAEKATDVGSGIANVDLAAFKKLEDTEEVIFVYFYDLATTSEDFMALERLTLNLVGHGKIVKTNDPSMADLFKISTWPRLMVSRDGKPSYYPPITPKDMRDTKRVLTWMKSVWLPLVPELTGENAREIMDGKTVVLAVLNRERSDEFIKHRRELKNAALEWIDKQDKMFQLERQELRDAKQLRIEEAEDRNDQRALRNAKGIRINMDDIEKKNVGFAWVDGIFWERWIKTTYGIDVKNGEKVVINDEDNRRYWDVTANGDPIRLSRTSILETLGKVTSSPPKISPKSTSGTFENIFWTIRGFCGSHPWLSLGVAIGFLLAGSMFGKSRMRRRAFGNTGAFFQLDTKEGLLGNVNGGGAKHD
ncbi:thioredoxin-like protein [Amniculicola lignicola CBS 123094]|uniref:Thioredoxin-like protein n=1 Tax=Amniculicola lignicola CBS 123094 TaxID=1392246 RepID=A0A6A5W5M5_9PLEO|nr:thioredoxin-like protein [Amniculicola lignicola CBS 123094]